MELLELNNSTYDHLNVYKEISSGLFKNNVAYKLFLYKFYIDTYMNSIWHEITLKEIICHKTQPNQYLKPFNCVQTNEL